MSNVLDEGENIEVNLGLPPPAIDVHHVDSSTGLARRVDPSPPQTPSISKDLNRTRSRMTFPFRQTKNVTPDAAPAPSKTSMETEGGTDLGSYFRKGGERHQAHIFEEEEPELLPSEVDSDEHSLAEAETAETLLGSALRMAEAETGGNVLSMATSSRLEAIDLGRRVSTLSDIRGANGVVRSPSLLPDDCSVHTWGSHATETTFINVPKVDPANITQERWGEIIGASITVGLMDGEVDGEMEDAPMEDYPMEDIPIDEVPIDDELPEKSKSPPRPKREVKPAVVRQAPGPSKDRKWDKLRNTLEAQERGGSVGYELEIDSNRSNKPGSPQRINLLGKGLQSLVHQKRTSKPTTSKRVVPNHSTQSVEALPSIQSAPSHRRDKFVEKSPQPIVFSKQRGDQPSQIGEKSNQRVKRPKQWFHKPRQGVQKPFDVNIQVEDLSKKRCDQNRSDQTLESEDLEAESMEVVYLNDQTGETLPPFPTKLAGQYI